MSVKREDADTGEVERLPFFKAVPVFDIAQTDTAARKRAAAKHCRHGLLTI